METLDSEPREDPYRERRRDMVRRQIAARGIRDPRVLAAMEKVPRHRFLPPKRAALAYEDGPVSIGFDQTISQPYIVALMSEAARVGPEDRVLEVGTGCGYQTAVLAELAGEVYSIEIVAPLAAEAKSTLGALGYETIHFRVGDGYRGWKEAAPFDAILVAAAPSHVPEALRDQLAVGGRMIVPVGGPGGAAQELIRITRTADGFTRESLLPVRFVPMTGEARGD